MENTPPFRAYNALIPAPVRYDKKLTANAKLLYGELTSLCNQYGYCWATNDYFVELYGLSVATISRLISQLEHRGYIRCEMVTTAKGSQRRIYAGMFLSSSVGDGGVLKNEEGGILKNEDPHKCINNNTKKLPYSPPERDKHPNSEKSCKESGTNWELFEQFWAAYPKCRHKKKESARRAWKKLRPSLELCQIMAAALERDIKSQDWQKEGGRYIPLPSSWLNGRRWEDEPDELPQAANGPAGQPVLPDGGKFI